MYPNITLKITNHTPIIVFQPEEGMNREMTAVKEDLSELILKIAKRLELAEENHQIIDILQLATEGDERLIEELPEFNRDHTDFELEDLINSNIDKFFKLDEEVVPSDVEVSEEVAKELIKNRNTDILASVVEMIYNILIAKTLASASELGIGKIKILDESGHMRLREKMASELSKIGIELEIIS